MTIWFKIRIGLCILGFAEGVTIAVLGLGTMSDIQLGFQLIVIPVVGLSAAFGILFVIGGQVRNPFSDKTWEIPDWNSNIIRFRQPLNFFHAGAYSVISLGTGCFAGSVFGGITYIIEGCTFLAGGLGILWGIRLCQKRYEDKFAISVETIGLEKDKEKEIMIRKFSRLKLIGFVLLFSGFVMMVTSAIYTIKTKRFADKAIETQCVIIGFDETKSDEGIMYKPRYEFKDETGEVHQGTTSWSSSRPKYKIGDSVPLLYDPDQVNESRINSFTDMWFMQTIIGSAGLFEILVGSIVLWYSSYKKKI